MGEDVSLRQLLRRLEIADDVISFRNALGNHPGGITLGLREAVRTFTKPNNGTGFSVGCRKPKSSTISIPLILKRELGQVLPAWVDVSPKDHRARTIEGVLLKARVTETDFPLKPWHTFYDWNFFVHVDPQYTYLVHELSRKENSTKFLGVGREDIIECEWDSAFVPLWAVPQEKCRIWMLGRWIYDCGHPEEGVAVGRHRTEIHPPQAIASFRSEAAKLPGTAGPTQVTRAAIYIGRKGGYIDQAINRDYAFDLHLPPNPKNGAEPVFLSEPPPGTTGPLPVEPRLTPIPARNPRLFRVEIPLRTMPKLEEYGVIITAGWSNGAAGGNSRIRQVRVTIDKVLRDKLGEFERPNWLFFISINARWHRLDLGSTENRVNVKEDLTLHDSDAIQITACGFERRNIFNFMGANTGLDSSVASRKISPSKRKDALEEIARTFRNEAAKHGPPLSDDNVPLILYSKRHSPDESGPFVEEARRNLGTFKNAPGRINYTLEYRIDQL